MDIEQTIEDYQRLRDACYEAARANGGELMGSDKWLRNALSEGDLNLNYLNGNSTINIHGYTYTNQTKDHEYFDFNIEIDTIKAYLNS